MSIKDTLTPSENEQLDQTVQGVVRGHLALNAVLHRADMPEKTRQRLSVAIGNAIGNLDDRNCAEFGLTAEETRTWMKAGRLTDAIPRAPEPDFSEDPGAVIPDIHPGHGKPI
jgi:uncharacterized SAM-dependent methyltransferase